MSLIVVYVPLIFVEAIPLCVPEGTPAIVTLSKLLVLSQVSCLNANFYQKEVLKLTFMTNINVVYPFVCTIVNEAILEDLEGSNEKLTYPSGCNLIRYFFLLKLSFRIFAQENVFILVKFWKTSTPM